MKTLHNVGFGHDSRSHLRVSKVGKSNLSPSHQPHIFLVPKSDARSCQNFQKTVLDGCSKEAIHPFLTLEEQNMLKGREKFQIWGIKGNVPSWKKIKPNDFMFFYKDKRIHHVAKVIFPKQSRELSEKLWGHIETSEGYRYWEYIFFLKDLIPVNLDYAVLKDIAQYSPKAYVQGFQTYSPQGTESIIKKYGSIEKFITL